ncbi:MAG: glycoside hydrolase family 92 protein [Chlorobi bacterium]|nr:glycoside hydrolase family 92 protein [Chlorobiota bacterium]
MKRIVSLALFLFVVMALRSQTSADYTEFVNPLVGTKNMGHTFPGACVPFGMVQLSPETEAEPYEKNGKYNPGAYRYCSGYQYDDSTIIGFSHTHFSGTGHSDLGDFLIMPTTGEIKFNMGTASNPESGYRSRYNHESETAKPAFYSVFLDDYSILAELTATTRVGFHKYTFPKTDSANIILDLMAGIYNYDGKNIWTFVRVENDTLVTGFRQTAGWARTKTVYFAMAFSKPILEYGHQKYDSSVYKGFWRKFDETKNFPEMAGRKIKAYFRFKTEKGESIKIKFALSSTSTAGAVENLLEEAPNWGFDELKQAGQQKWNKELSKIQGVFMNETQKETFYTALYHCFLSPVVYMDVDGMYKGLDQNIHKAKGFTNYTIFSLWDTFRALHPLFNIVQTSRNKDMIESMMAHYEQSVHKMLPVWSHYSNENWCMIGYHAVSVLADAMVKGVIAKDPKYLDAAVTTANNAYYDGIPDYKKFGFVPEDKSSSSVSKTLEYAYDDWCIEQMATALGEVGIAREFSLRAENYKKLFDSNTGFMRAKSSNGEWISDFNTLNTHQAGYIEGNAWTYSLFVPQDPEGLIALMGGKNAFSRHLDSLFAMELSDEHIAESEDITRDGIMGNYVHGNEPGHHIAYLYNYCGDEWKTQMRVRMIMGQMYSNTVDGLCGNDDAGQMSAWYIFSSLGFYPVSPGSAKYDLGSPMVVSADINLENGKVFQIKTLNQSEHNVYVKKVVLNGKLLKRNYILHSEITKGGILEFYMSGQKN